VGGNGDAYRGIGPRQLLDHEGVIRVTQPGAAVRFGKDDPEKAELTQLLDDLRWEAFLFVPL
jgi:hypothetical protein